VEHIGICATDGADQGAQQEIEGGKGATMLETNKDPTRAEVLLLMLHVVQWRQGHEQGPSEEEVREMVSDYLFNVGLCPHVTTSVRDYLGSDWAWVKESEEELP